MLLILCVHVSLCYENKQTLYALRFHNNSIDLNIKSATLQEVIECDERPVTQQCNDAGVLELVLATNQPAD